MSQELLKCVTDADLHARLESVPYSTSLREIITVGDMLDRYQKSEGGRETW